MLFSRILGIIGLSNIKEFIMKTDIEIAQSIELEMIVDVVKKKGLEEEDIEV